MIDAAPPPRGGSEVSPGCLLQNQLVERQIRDRPPESQILLLKILHPPRLVGLQTAIFLAPPVVGLRVATIRQVSAADVPSASTISASRSLPIISYGV